MSNRRQFITTLCGATIGVGTIPSIGSVVEFNQLEYDQLYLKWHRIIDFALPTADQACSTINTEINKYRCAKEMERFESQLSSMASEERTDIGKLIIPTIRRKYSNANPSKYINHCNFSYDSDDHILTVKFKGRNIIISQLKKILDLSPYYGYTAIINIGNYQKQLVWEEWVHPEVSLWTEIEKCLCDCGIL
jgi:hypothetical protein